MRLNGEHMEMFTEVSSHFSQEKKAQAMSGMKSQNLNFNPNISHQIL